jgi:hypothetical protein
MSGFQSPARASAWLSRFQSTSPIVRPRFLVIGGVVSLLLTTLFIFGAHNDYKFLNNGGAFRKKPFQQCTSSDRSAGRPDSSSDDGWEFIASRDGDNYALSSDQCQSAFPKLFVEIDKSVSSRRDANSPITFQELNARRKLGQGMVRAIVDRGEVSSLSTLVGDSFLLNPSALVVHYRIRGHGLHTIASAIDATLSTPRIDIDPEPRPTTFGRIHSLI